MESVIKTEKTAITLLLVDVQKDFHHPGGSLPVPNSDQDAERLVDFIQKSKEKIDRVVATMDSHYKLHIAHPGFWVDGETKKKHPDPFMIISHQDIVDEKWVPCHDAKELGIDLKKDLTKIIDPPLLQESGMLDVKKYAEQYTHKLEEKGRFPHSIWPEHCLIDTEGHDLVDTVREALEDWSKSSGKEVEYVRKGQNLLTEMFSAIKAEVPVNAATDTNEALLEKLQTSKQLIVCGQAKSHCVNYTLRDIVKRWPKDRVGDIVLLTNCTSSVSGFEEAGAKFEADMKAVGVKTMTTEEVYSEW